LRPRRGDAPTDARLPNRPGGGGEAAETTGELREAALGSEDRSFAAEVDASLRPLARALLALAEQLSREEGP
jgi:hypothetical protein